MYNLLLSIIYSLQIRSTYLKYRPKVKVSPASHKSVHDPFVHKAEAFLTLLWSVQFLCGIWPMLHIESQKTSWRGEEGMTMAADPGPPTLRGPACHLQRNRRWPAAGRLVLPSPRSPASSLPSVVRRELEKGSVFVYCRLDQSFARHVKETAHSRPTLTLIMRDTIGSRKWSKGWFGDGGWFNFVSAGVV